MPVSAGRGPLSKAVRNLCHALDQGEITKEQFRAKLSSLTIHYRYLGVVAYQDVGLALDYWIRMRHKDREVECWQLADQIDLKIRKAFEHWKRAMSK